MDDRMRRLERRAAQGDDAARAQLTAERLRSGQLERQRVAQAAHLRDPIASQVDPGVLQKVDCRCGGLAACHRCGGTGSYCQPTDLVPFVRQADIDLRGVLLPWACDCAEHVVPRAQEGDTPDELRTIIGRARDLDPHLVPVDTGAPCMVHRAVQLLVNAAIMIRSLQAEARCRTALAGVATCAYRAAGNSRDERGWQIAALTRRLLE